MQNLLKETMDTLKRNGKSVEDVLWIGNLDLWTDWESFAESANVEYDNGYGKQYVADDLLVVGEDWWLERYEYDGYEEWQFKTLPIRPASVSPHLVVLGS